MCSEDQKHERETDMNALTRFLAISLSALMMTGCEIIIGSSTEDDDEKEHDKDPMEVVFDGSSDDSDFDFSQPYLFTLTGDNNRITLGGDVKEIVITGSFNYVIVKDQAQLQLLRITGNHNVLVQDEDIELHVDEIELMGNNNFISLHSYDKVADIGDDNQLLGMEGD